MSFRNRWSSRTSSRIASGSWSRCHRHSSRPALSPSPSGAAARGLDRVGGGAKFVRGDVGDSRGLASSVRGMPCRPSQVSRRGVRVAGRRACLRHRALAPHPGADLRDRLPRPRILRPSRLEEIKNVLRARCRPQGEELVIRIREGSPAADHHETRVAVVRGDHGQHPCSSHLPKVRGVRAGPRSGVNEDRERLAAEAGAVGDERDRLQTTTGPSGIG
jgi:hypothetical protein